jgi:hypothetical protein
MNKTLRNASVSFALVGCLVNWPTQAQTSQTPNFSGQWVADGQASDPPSSPMARPPICYQQCVITQTQDKLVVKDNLSTSEFRLDGVPVTTTHASRAETTTMTAAAKWEGAVLVITRVAKGPKDKGFTSVARLSLSNGRLTIAGTRPHPDGSAIEYKVVYKAAQGGPTFWMAIDSK